MKDLASVFWDWVTWSMDAEFLGSSERVGIDDILCWRRERINHP